MGFPAASGGKESACNPRDLGLIPGLGRSPGRGHEHPLQDSCLENPHGQSNLVGYSPWGHKELDMTEQLSIHTRQPWGFPGGSVVKNPPAMQEMWVQPLGQEDSLEKKMATCTSSLAWEIPWTEEHDGPYSPSGHERVVHNLTTK